MRNFGGKRTIALAVITALITSVILGGCTSKNSNKSNSSNSKVTTTKQETTNSTTTKVVETTTQPPKPDYSEAYKAYKTVLKQNAFEIKDYDFQNETNKSKQIVFADILGDDTPELIFSKATIDSRDKSRKNASHNIYSYANGKCEKISFEDDYSSDLKDEYILQTDDIQMYTPYIIYQKKNDKSLYMFQQKSQQL